MPKKKKKPAGSKKKKKPTTKRAVKAKRKAVKKKKRVMTKAQKKEIKKIIDAGRRLGVEIDDEKALKWIEDMKAAQATAEDLAIDKDKGVYGHEVSLIDFDSDDLERFRRVADIVGLPDTGGVVETAISLSGSAAQGKVQRYPGDLDFFERVNIIVNTREEASKIIGKVMREKALDKFYSPTYQLIEVKWGTWKENVIKGDKTIKAGSPMSWNATEVKQGYIKVKDQKGKAKKINWAYGEKDPGWCKLDWLIAEPEKGIVNVSNMLDVTWEAPEGNIIPLDGQLDPYFQEVYLEAESVPLFSKLREHLTPDKLDNYVKALEGQVRHYTEEGHENYGKVAKRLYNIFRLTGAHIEAMFIRELFDEPAAALYQVWSLLDTIDDAGKPDSTIDKKTVAKQASDLVKLVVETCEGEAETKIVEALMTLRDDITGVEDISDKEWSKTISESRFLVVKLVNEYFYNRLNIVPKIVKYIEQIRKEASH
ncbi:MAG: hypothetical protein HWN65_16205 [Candidatus Helarchaeota archaeon]|nr:hypothetical protein [Candidatus Helarchaeota archaeon]